MFSANEFKSHLLGVFEISIFMKAGVSRFQPDFKMMLRSFFWPALLMPVAVVTASLLSSDAARHSFDFLLMLHSFRIIATFGLSLGLIYFLAKKTDRTQYIFQYITTTNWFEIAMFIIVSPILVILMMGGVVDDIQNYAIFVTCLGVVYCGYIVTHALRIPWELATLVAVSLLFVQETGFDLVSM